MTKDTERAAGILLQTLGKNLTELLVLEAHMRPAPVAIVRPSLVTSLAGWPYPGFCGNLAGGFPPPGLDIA